MKKRILLFLFLLMIIPSVVFGAISSKYVATHGFDSAVDGYGIIWSSSISEVGYIKYTNTDTGVNRLDYDDQSLKGIILRCNNNFKIEYFNAGGTLLATDTITVSGVKEPSTSGICGQAPTNPEPEPEPKPECVICECINTLNPILEGIAKDIETNKETLKAINITINSIDNSLNDIKKILLDIKGELQDILSELQTDMQPPTYEKPYNSDLDSYKPDLDIPVYEDKNVYFKDEGEASTPPNMPTTIPDAKPWKNEDGLDMEKDTPYAPEEVLEKDPEKSIDPEQERDPEQIKDPENNRDPEQERDPENNRDPEQTKDPENNRDPVPTKDDEFDLDEFERNHFYEQDEPMGIDEQQGCLRWVSIKGEFLCR